MRELERDFSSEPLYGQKSGKVSSEYRKTKALLPDRGQPIVFSKKNVTVVKCKKNSQTMKVANQSKKLICTEMTEGIPDRRAWIDDESGEKLSLIQTFDAGLDRKSECQI